MSSLLHQLSGTSSRIVAPAAIWTPRCLPLILVLSAAILVRHIVAVDPDVSWLLTVAERVLDGQRLYADVVEANPPASVLLYMPSVAITRAAGLRPEIVVDASVLLAICASLWVAGHILARARLLDVDGWYLAAWTAAVLTLLPAQTFANRDHVALIAFLPALAVYAARSRGISPRLGLTIAAGLGAGVTVAIKPHFALPVFACAAAGAACARSWRVLLAAENWTAGAVILAYGLVVMLVFPTYVTDMVPLVAAVYAAVRPSLLELILQVPLPLWLAGVGVIAILKRRTALDAPFCLVLVAAAGFALAFLIQGKGWAYQSYPMLALMLIALAFALVPTWRMASAASGGRVGRFVPTLVAGAVAAASFGWMNHAADTSALADAVRRVKVHPSVLAITSEIAVGHPLVRDVGGTWAGRVCSQWITTGVLLRRQHGPLDGATIARLASYEERDRAMLSEDLARARPDIVLIERVVFDWSAWARADPALAEQLKPYREVGSLYGIAILTRDGQIGG